MEQEFNRTLTESAVRRTIRSMKKSSERAIRNLVDLGIEFSKDPIQISFFESIQKLLSDRNSAYYFLAKDAANSVDTDTLITFSMNFRYNGFEAGDSGEIISLAKSHPERAFILFLKGEQIDDSLIEEIKALKNIMVSAYLDTDMSKACRKLRASRLLYSVDFCVSEQNAEQIFTETQLKSAARAHPVFFILRPNKDISPDTRQRIHNHVISIRNSGHFPFIMLDFEQDIQMIKESLSCTVSNGSNN